MPDHLMYMPCCALEDRHRPPQHVFVLLSCWQVLSGYEDGSVVLWDARQPGAALASERGHSEPVMCLAVSPAGAAQAVSGSAADELCCWSLCGTAPAAAAAAAAEDEALSPAPHGTGASRPAAALSSAALAAAAAGEACGSDPATVPGVGGTGLLVRSKRLKLPVAGVADVAFRADGRILASAGWDGKVGV